MARVPGSSVNALVQTITNQTFATAEKAPVTRVNCRTGTIRWITGRMAGSYRRPRRTIEPVEPSPRNIAVVVSRYNSAVTNRLLEGAITEIQARGITEDRIAVIDAPGAFELTSLSAEAAKTGAYAGVVAIGCLIHGETLHDRYIADAVAQGVTQAALQTGVPIAFGLVTAETPEHAEARSGGAKGNKGQEAAAALLDTLDSIAAVRRAVAEGRPCRVERLDSQLPQDKS